MSGPRDDREAVARARARIYRYAAKVGIILGLFCHALPERYQHPCGAVLGFLSVTCGVK